MCPRLMHTYKYFQFPYNYPSNFHSALLIDTPREQSLFSDKRYKNGMGLHHCNFHALQNIVHCHFLESFLVIEVNTFSIFLCMHHLYSRVSESEALFPLLNDMKKSEVKKGENKNIQWFILTYFWTFGVLTLTKKNAKGRQ